MDTMRIIYSFTEDDPEDITGLEYHGPVPTEAPKVLF